MIPVAEALESVLKDLKPVSREEIPVIEGLGRVLAEDVSANLTYPPSDISAMDGYAVLAADTTSLPCTVRQIGISQAGAGFEGAVSSGETVRIFTGAPLPEGADAIVIQENGVKKYIITAVDYYTRIAVARAYPSPSSRNAKDLLMRMKIALGEGIRAVNTDNGSEFMAEYEQACVAMAIKHFYTYPRTPKMNPYAERFNRTIQEEAQFPLFSESFEVWNNFISHYIMLYNFFRPHYSLDYLTPVDVYLKSKQSNMWWTHTRIGLNLKHFIYWNLNLPSE